MPKKTESTLLPDERRAAVRCVRIKNFRSIGKCEVELASLTMLIGRNAAGKSNFLDAMRFLVDSLRTSLDHAIKSRGGLDSVRRRSTGHPRNFAIELDLFLPGHRTCVYGFEIASRSPGGFVVKRERLAIRTHSGQREAFYETEAGEIRDAFRSAMPPVAADRLYLVTAASLPEVRPAYDALLAMGFYNLNPDKMKELQSPDAGELLHRDGDNLPSVIARLRLDRPEQYARIQEFLRVIVPGIDEVDRVPLGPRETVEFRQTIRGSTSPWRFYAANMSDGTLRALGALVAVTQLANHATPVTLIGIEEPETALHPAAAGALVDALREAATYTQVVATSHSPDLLDQLDLESEALQVVVSRAGTTEIAPPDPASLATVRSHLFTPGELLRQDQLEPNLDHLERIRQLRLFGSDEDE
ncbi:MAG: AAA family ATPase [Phycisphaerae bacterium]